MVISSRHASLRRRARLGALLLACSSAFALLGAAAPASLAANGNAHIRMYSDINANYSGGGNALDGVSGLALVLSPSANNTALNGNFAHVEMDSSQSAGTSFVQFGSFQGAIANVVSPTASDPCGGTVQNYAAPHAFLIYYLTNHCGHETAVDLGAFGSTGNYRSFGIRRDTNGTYYASLDNNKLANTAFAFPAAMYPSAGMDSNARCTTAKSDFENTAASPYSTLQLHDNVQGWRYWSGNQAFYTDFTGSSAGYYGYGIYASNVANFHSDGPATC